MPNRILHLSTTAAMLVATPALASADVIGYSAMSPVAITSVQLNDSYAPGGSGDQEGPPQFRTGGVTLKFINNGSVQATGVTFGLTEGKYSQIIVDKGRFRPSTQIVHTFNVADGSSALTNPTVDVVEVDFADGSAWHKAPRNAAIAQATEAADTAVATSAPMSTMDAMSAGRADAAQINADARRSAFRNLGSSL